ncbi:hypothetical protein FQN54_005947 [Arachnomyces sp. PD_36]|nr:hypothetical protein FQN54_005947 [Arachnomyces sp. PD_36]
MDIYGTTVTVMQQVYQVTMFIKGVVSDIETYDDDKRDIRLKLDIQLIFLESFEHLFFDSGQNGNQGLRLASHFPPKTAKTVMDLVSKLKRILAEYELVASKYGLAGGDTDESGDGELSVKAEERKKISFLDKVKTKAKVLKKKGYDWALFDKERLQEVMTQYKEWSDNLRDLMQHFLQLAPLTQTSGGTENQVSKTAGGMGLQNVVKRQALAKTGAPAHFQALEGEITKEDNSTKGYTLADWSHKGEHTRVVVEYHPYDAQLRASEDLEPDEIAALKEPIRNLAWLLQNSSFPDSETPSSESDQPIIHSLQCLGFMDQPLEERAALFYKLPSSTEHSEETPKLTTLHELINTVDPRTRRPLRKPSLGDRFALAHALALTLLNVHGSGWVHKNIWSRGILLFPTAKVDHRSDTGDASARMNDLKLADSKPLTQLLPFLGDWGYARLAQAGTELRGDFEVEPNLYRHPQRQGKPNFQFSKKHDIYAVGVVLLEIGIWRTLSQILERNIKDSEKNGKLPKSREVQTGLINIAKAELSKEMGDGYADAVLSCLTGKLGDGNEIDISLSFKEKVVETIALGTHL